jgi:hypothetical protein
MEHGLYGSDIYIIMNQLIQLLIHIITISIGNYVSVILKGSLCMAFNFKNSYKKHIVF